MTGTVTEWRLWRQTATEPGSAPAFEELDEAHRALWFGPLAHHDACRAAWARICRWIADTYPGCHALGTPGATGLSLIAHTLPWGPGQRPYQYPLLDMELARLLAATAPQHRIEHLALEGGTMRRYVLYDARVAHAAYLRHLPVLLSELVHDTGPYVPYHAGKYLVRVTVPQDWAHIGLAHRPRPHGAGWEWPSTPGEEWECWLDTVEVRLLTDMGWPFAVRERLLFSGPKAPGNDPLREHAERLTAALEQWDRAPRTPVNLATRAALRALALHPIGLWHKQHNQRTRHISDFDELTPEDASATIVPDAAGGYTVQRSAALSAWQAHWRRPEWSTTVYARERATVTRRALSLARGHLLAIRGDALHLADDDPGWEDTGRVGNFRKQVDYAFPEPQPLPESAFVLTGWEVLAKMEAAQHGE